MIERWAEKIQWGKIADGLKPVARVWNISPGGWITLMVTGLVVICAVLIKRHYTQTRQDLQRLNDLVSVLEMNNAQPPFSRRIGRSCDHTSGSANDHSEKTTPTGGEPI